MDNKIKFCAVCGSSDIKETLTDIYKCAACGKEFAASVVGKQTRTEKSVFVGEYADVSDDPCLPEVLARAIKDGGISTSMIQRKFSIGYSKAGRLVDFCERAGYVTPITSCNKPRKVLMTREQYREVFGREIVEDEEE